MGEASVSEARLSNDSKSTRNDFIDCRKLPLGATPERAVEILPLLAGFTEHQWAFPRKEDLEMVDEILDINNMTVEDAIDELGTVCSDFLLVCSFAGKKFPCMQVSVEGFI